MPHDDYLKSIESSHACDEGYFYLLFPWRARSTFPWTRHISPPNIWQQLTNYRMRGLSCWHVITRSQLSSFLFPLKPCHANLLNRVDHFLTCVRLRNMERLLVKTYLNCSIVFFLLAGEKIRRPPSVYLLNELTNIPFLQYINKTGFRACVKELYEAKYDPLSVTYTVLSGKSSTATKLINFSTYKSLNKKKKEYKQYTKGMHKNWRK